MNVSNEMRYPRRWNYPGDSMNDGYWEQVSRDSPIEYVCPIAGRVRAKTYTTVEDLELSSEVVELFHPAPPPEAPSEVDPIDQLLKQAAEVSTEPGAEWLDDKSLSMPSEAKAEHVGLPPEPFDLVINRCRDEAKEVFAATDGSVSPINAAREAADYTAELIRLELRPGIDKRDAELAELRAEVERVRKERDEAKKNERHEYYRCKCGEGLNVRPLGGTKPCDSCGAELNGKVCIEFEWSKQQSALTAEREKSAKLTEQVETLASAIESHVEQAEAMKKQLDAANAGAAARLKAMQDCGTYDGNCPDHAHSVRERWDDGGAPCRRCIEWNAALQSTAGSDLLAELERLRREVAELRQWNGTLRSIAEIVEPNWSNDLPLVDEVIIAIQQMKRERDEAKESHEYLKRHVDVVSDCFAKIRLRFHDAECKPVALLVSRMERVARGASDPDGFEGLIRDVIELKAEGVSGGEGRDD